MQYRSLLLLFLSATVLNSIAQDRAAPVPVFNSQRLINVNTVELLPPGTLSFNVMHHFGDVAGPDGGTENFFGLESASDVKIGFVYGISKKLNIGLARAKGAGQVRQLYELSIYYRLLQQREDNHPFLSMTVFGNAVVSGMRANAFSGFENSYSSFADRGSSVVQLLMAKRIGIVSVQVAPAFLHNGYVPLGVQGTLPSVSGAIRIPVKEWFNVIADYSHSFYDQDAKRYYAANDIDLHDVFGIGIEKLTAGHVFHLNFTNATEILENRYLAHTSGSWGRGQFRWAFKITREFDLTWKKRHRSDQ